MSKDWGFYFAEIDGKDASVCVDLGVKERVPIEGLPLLTWATVKLREPDENGLSRDHEYDRLAQIEDALAARIEMLGDRMVYVGRTTWSGERTFYFYAASGQEAEAALTETLHDYPDYEFLTGERDDAGWEHYLEFLHPSPPNRQIIENGRTMRRLSESGDRHELPRSVQHSLYFHSGEDRARFLQSVRNMGFTVDAATESADRPPYLFNARVSKVEPLDLESMNHTVLALFQLALECGGAYDSWDAPVVRDA